MAEEEKAQEFAGEDINQPDGEAKSEEKPQITKKEKVAEEEKPTAAPKKETAAEGKKEGAPKREAKAAEAVEKKKLPEKVKPSNCAQCNKVLKHRMWYYRNRKFFCNKRCWKKSVEKAAE